MWWYRIRIPGNIPQFPLPYYEYIGITVKDDPYWRINQHPHEPKLNNEEFREICKYVPFELWEIETFELPIIGNNGEQNLTRLKELEVEKIAKYNTYLGDHGLNATPGGEDPFGGSLPGKSSGAKHICWVDFDEYWVYRPTNTTIAYRNKDLRILSRILKSKGLLKIINQNLWKRSLMINDNYITYIRRKINYLGAFGISISKRSTAIAGCIFQYQPLGKSRKYRKSSTLPSKLLHYLSVSPDTDLEETFFDFQYFIYCMTALITGHYDHDHKLVKNTFMTEEEFQQQHTFTLDNLQEAIEFLRVAEHQAKVIQTGQTLLQPQTINTTNN